MYSSIAKIESVFIITIIKECEFFGASDFAHLCHAEIRCHEINLVILDIMLPVGDQNVDFDLSKISNPKYTGTFLFKYIRELFHKMPIIIRSSKIEEIDKKFFSKQKQLLFLAKDVKSDVILSEVATFFEGKNGLHRSIIVHGDDEIAKFELIDFIRKTIKLSEPIVLHEEPDCGKRIMKNIHNYLDKIDFVFVILPNKNDDFDNNSCASRERITFETGFLTGVLKKNNCYVVILYNETPDFPVQSDNMILIDVSKGINASSNKIYKEIKSLD